MKELGTDVAVTGSRGSYRQDEYKACRSPAASFVRVPPVGYLVVVTEPRDGPDGPAIDRPDIDDAVAPELERLPHQPPMRLIVAVLARDHQAVLCRARIPADYPVAGEGQSPAVVSVEIAAQASALLAEPAHAAGNEAGQTGRAEGRVGYLVSVRRVSFETPTLPTEAPLLVRAVQAGQAGPLQMVQFELIQEHQGGEVPGQTAGTVGVADARRWLTEGLPPTELLARGTLGTFSRQPESSE